MSDGEAYERKRKQQLTGSYGNYTVVNTKYLGGRYPTDIIYCKTAESEGLAYHPNQKPVELGRYLIKTFSKQGDIVLDNACGSGSFLVAAVKEKRKYIGIEKNEGTFRHKTMPVDFIKLAKQRIG
jgi:site-specific DNA-methyltransferase (adenine-specific)/modification methylase